VATGTGERGENRALGVGRTPVAAPTAGATRIRLIANTLGGDLPWEYREKETMLGYKFANGFKKVPDDNKRGVGSRGKNQG